ncbi:uncharacterized protein BHQ10_000527 [Talaromyces amestolkiae]|uniref:Ig-like domain-containing protein n=1 Tax=Talaromyces amestolkiae TaxID=1196081 RepID=A0A364KLU6_TALAM|nr:uncharacterized protein BHQ10_000527 [Talaromyces amestolkiae]RAO64515.1 hypothetical protein BHQ10_000527 [Talaromyces amestolkiae]
MKYIAAFAALLSVVVADEFGTASVYCGSSCTDGTLIWTGNATTRPEACTDLGATYEYCYFEVDPAEYTANWALQIGGNGVCNVAADPVVDAGDCSAAGSYDSYDVYFYL